MQPPFCLNLNEHFSYRPHPAARICVDIYASILAAPGYGDPLKAGGQKQVTNQMLEPLRGDAEQSRAHLLHLG